MTAESSTLDARSVVGATAAYRGYRRQALYVLSRILKPGQSHLAFQPEGIEDLAIYEGERLVEVCQVKALEAPLSLADLHRERADSFFRRAAARHPKETAALHVVSFGPVGPELSAASLGNPRARDALVKKLTAKGYSSSVATNLISRLSIEEVTELRLKEDLVAWLRSSFLGRDPEAAFDLLSFWIYIKSEERARLTAAEAKTRIERVASALADIDAHSREWYTTIEPLTGVVPDEARLARLRHEFFQGIAVRYEHIAAGLAVQRPHHLARIQDGFSRNQVVVVHAASGQGKTALAYSYMHGLPDCWRFRVKAIEDRQHALSVARALLGHARAVGVPLFVYLDVSSQDLNWPVLATELCEDPQMRLLVTIREEDWRRTRSIFQFELSEVDLTLGEEEARQVYERLKEARCDVPPTFDEAWSAFHGEGPLLEFTYLLTQGARLRDRLAEQVARLRDDVRGGKAHPNELHLLRLVSVAGAYNAKISVTRLVDSLSLPDPQRILELFENEYLIRRSENDRFVGGLHAVRSEILTRLLCDDAVSPWGASALDVVGLIDERDLEGFLIHSFALRPRRDWEPLLTSPTKLQPRTWSGFCGAVRALTWRGIADYAEACKPLIDEAEQRGRGLWWLFLDSDVANAIPGVANSLLDIISGLSEVGAANAEMGRALRARQPPKGDIWKLLFAWLQNSESKPHSPVDDRDWKSAGEACLLCSRAGHRLPISDWIPIEHFITSASRIVLDDLATLSFGIGTVYDVVPEWLSHLRRVAIERYRREQQVVRLADGDGIISIDFVCDGPGQQEEGSGGDFYNHEAVRRLDILHRLVPDRLQYGSQGWGHRIPGIDVDGTRKRIPGERLTSPLLTDLNLAFHGYVALWSRPRSWEAFRDGLRTKREAIVTMLDRLAGAVRNYHRKARSLVIGGDLSVAVLDEWQKLLAEADGLPTATVAPWGVALRGSAQKEHEASQRAMEGFFRSLSNFVSQCVHGLVYFPILGRMPDGNERDREIGSLKEHGIEKRLADLAETNLHEAWHKLPEFQASARRYMEPSECLARIEQREQRALEKLVHAWGIFCRSPRRRSEDVCRDGADETQRSLKVVLRDVRTALRSQSGGCSWEARALALEGEGNVLLLTANGQDAAKIAAAIPDGIVATSKVLQGLSTRIRALVQLYWPRLVIVPLLCQRPFESEGIVIDTLVAASPGWQPEWWHLVRRPIPRPALERAGLAPWDLPAVNIGRPLVGAGSVLLAVANHLSDLPARSDLDDLGQDILTCHVGHYVMALRASIEVLADNISTAETWVLAQDAGAPTERAEAAKLALTAVSDAMRHLGQPEKCAECLPEWIAQAKEIQECSAVAYLALASEAVARALENTKESQ